MAHINISTAPDDQEAVFNTIKQLNGATAPVSMIARLSGLKESTVRYVIMDLIEQHRIVKVPVRSFNAHYIRYRYDIVV